MSKMNALKMSAHRTAMILRSWLRGIPQLFKASASYGFTQLQSISFAGLQDAHLTAKEDQNTITSIEQLI
jgi:hypothetical protein